MRYYRAHFQRTIDMRVYKAFFYSLDGLKAAFRDEAAFREVVLMAVIGMPLALWLDLTSIEAFADDGIATLTSLIGVPDGDGLTVEGIGGEVAVSVTVSVPVS